MTSSNILIAYYSWSGNTREVAGLIQKETGGTLFEIEPTQPYTTDYRAAVAQAREEIRSGFQPELSGTPDMGPCSIVFLGTPIWCSTMAPPLASFIHCCDLGNRTVIPFHTHGGGGAGSLETDIAKMCPNSTVKPGFGTHNRGDSHTRETIRTWLHAMGL